MKLADAAEHLPAVLDEATVQHLSVTATLERPLAIEVNATQARRLAGRLRFACLPTPATTVEDFDYDAASGVDPHLIADLATGHYLESATNILMIGHPVGKAHLAVGLARKAAESGYRTYVTTAADLAARCHRAAIEGRCSTTMRFYAGPTLLVIDLRRHRDYAEVRDRRLSVQ